MIRHGGLTAAILAGGRASRLGGAIKTLLPLAGGRSDTPLSRIQGVFAPRGVPCLIVAADPGPFASLGIPVVPDRVTAAGPLGGVEAALSAARTPLVFVCGGDMPSLCGALIDFMVEQARPGRLLVPVRAGRPEPLHALYPAACLPSVRQALDEGIRMMLDYFARAPVEYLEESSWSAIPGAARSFDNINTPEDLAAARAS